MKSQIYSGKKSMIKTILAVIIVSACFLSSCNKAETTTDHTTENWIDSITDENGIYIGQDKEVVGCYKRIGIVKVGETYEDMLELRDTFSICCWMESKRMQAVTRRLTIVNESFDVQEYMTQGVERVVSDALKATLKDPRESAFMVKFAASSRMASKRCLWH